MKNESLVIMAGGASSRMKRSLQDVSLPDNVLEAARSLHKSLVPLGESGKPLLYYLFKNAVAAKIKNIYLITSPENSAFKAFVEKYREEEGFASLKVRYAIQKVPEGREKPLGTADALQQCLEQHTDLLDQNFTVCNADNLYGVEALKVLQQERSAANALISYSGEGLGHSEEKIIKFALLDFTADNYLLNILEKPTEEELNSYKSRHNELWVSMNIFNFHGATIFPFLQNCPLHPTRNEKELPNAVRHMVEQNPQSMLCIPRSEQIPDLTSANDIVHFFG